LGSACSLPGEPRPRTRSYDQCAIPAATGTTARC